jgi:hypothetical protein
MMVIMISIGDSGDYSVGGVGVDSELWWLLWLVLFLEVLLIRSGGCSDYY